MTKIRFILPAVLFAGQVIACSPLPAAIPQHIENTPAEKITYIDGNGVTIEEYDVTTRVIDVFFRSSGSYVRSEFGSVIIFCSNEQFQCLSSFLHVAVPRGRRVKRWQVAGLSCIRLNNMALNEAEIRCLYRDGSVIFTYSEDRGILSYQRICSGCSSSRFVLSSRFGLFALR